MPHPIAPGGIAVTPARFADWSLPSSRTLGSLLAGGLLLGLLLLAVVPLAPSLPDPAQDSAWQYALNQAVAGRLSFGRDVIFNLGPLGAVYTMQFHPATDALMLAGAALVALALAAGLSALAGGARRWVVLLVPVLISVNAMRDPLFIATPLLLLALAVAMMRPNATVPRGWLADLALALLTAACALLTLIKATFGTQAVPMVALALTALALGGRWRRAAGLAVIYAVSLGGCWLLAGQRLDRLPDYLAAVPLLIEGYTEGGALGGPPSDIIAYLAAAAMLFGLLARDRGRRGLAGNALLGCGLAFTLFVAFKAGFVRHDAHALIALGSLSLLPLVLVHELRARDLAAALLAGLAALVFVGGHYAASRALSLGDGYDRLAAATESGWARLADPGELGRRFAANLAAIRAAAPLPRLDGPTDVYSTGQTALLAAGLDWSPRPALQSVTAFSAAMAQADLDHLQGVGTGRPAVQNVFFRVEYDDNRLRAIEDGLSWPALLSAFALRDFDRARDLARLERLPGLAAAEPATVPLLEGRFAVGRSVALPAAPDGLIWARLDIRPTLAGRLAALLFRPPLLHVTLRDADGRESQFRLLSGPARAGFLLSPVVQDTQDFLSLLLPERAATRYRPVSLSVSGESGTRLLWQPDFGLSLRLIAVPPQPAARRLILAAPAAPPPGLAQAAAAGVAGDCALDDVDGRRSGPQPQATGGNLRVRGWATIPGPDGLRLADQLYVQLTDDAGRAWVSPVQTRLPRQDVAAHYGRPDITGAGFDTPIDLTGLAGAFSLSVEQLRDGRRWTCAARQRLVISGG